MNELFLVYLLSFAHPVVGQYNVAYTKASDAFFTQIGAKQNYNETRGTLEKKGEDIAPIGALVYSVRSIREKKLYLHIKGLGDVSGSQSGGSFVYTLRF